MSGVLVVDDQHLIRTGIATLLGTRQDELGPIHEAADGQAAIAAVTAEQPGLVLMDIRMPGLNGIDAARTILRLPVAEPPRVVILTTYDQDALLYAALRAGCSGFLLKDMPPGQLLSAVIALSQSDVLVAPARLRTLVEYHAVPEAPPVPGPLSQPPARLPAQLTQRELQVLRFVAQGLDNEDIAQRICVSVGTVKTHVHRMMTKLELRSRAQAVVFAYENGIATARASGTSGMRPATAY
ncbi:response regulator transcription factor [Streptomyces hundungensis]|uniref:response regulator transcription factor n=1 Tax=Streptomyces hundungensis TaxID=1077946 RepID=UPI0033F5A7BB